MSGLDYTHCSFSCSEDVYGVKEEFFREELHCMTIWLDDFWHLPWSCFTSEMAVWALLVGSAHKELGFSKVKFIWPIFNVL